MGMGHGKKIILSYPRLTTKQFGSFPSTPDEEFLPECWTIHLRISSTFGGLDWIGLDWIGAMDESRVARREARGAGSSSCMVGSTNWLPLVLACVRAFVLAFGCTVALRAETNSVPSRNRKRPMALETTTERLISKNRKSGNQGLLLPQRDGTGRINHAVRSFVRSIAKLLSSVF